MSYTILMNEKQSACDIIKENTTRVMHKIDTQIPLFVKMYSDLYKEYMRTVEDLFDAGYNLERAEINTMFRDPWSKNAMEHSVRTSSNTMLVNLDIYGEYLKWYSGMRIAGMRSIDQLVHSYMNAIGLPISNTMTSDTKKEHKASTNKTTKDKPTQAKQTRTQRGRRKAA